MTRSIWEIGRLQLLENVRREVHLVTLFMAFAILILPAYVNTFSLGLQAFRIASVDLGLTVISYYGVVMAIMLGASVLPRDIERKTIYPILARPISRFSYLVGQFLGAAVLLAGSLGLLALALLLGVGSLTHQLELDIFIAALGYSLECSIVIAACLCFSTFLSPTLAGVFGLGLYVLGGLSGTSVAFFLGQNPQLSQMSSQILMMKTLLPNFEVFRLKHPVVHDLTIHSSYLSAFFLYACGWILVFLFLASLRFERRDL